MENQSDKRKRLSLADIIIQKRNSATPHEHTTVDEDQASSIVGEEPPVTKVENDKSGGETSAGEDSDDSRVSIVGRKRTVFQDDGDGIRHRRWKSRRTKKLLPILSNESDGRFYLASRSTFTVDANSSNIDIDDDSMYDNVSEKVALERYSSRKHNYKREWEGESSNRRSGRRKRPSIDSGNTKYREYARRKSSQGRDDYYHDRLLQRQSENYGRNELNSTRKESYRSGVDIRSGNPSVVDKHEPTLSSILKAYRYTAHTGQRRLSTRYSNSNIDKPTNNNEQESNGMNKNLDQTNTVSKNNLPVHVQKHESQSNGNGEVVSISKSNNNDEKTKTSGKTITEEYKVENKKTDSLNDSSKNINTECGNKPVMLDKSTRIKEFEFIMPEDVANKLSNKLDATSSESSGDTEPTVSSSKVEQTNPSPELDQRDDCLKRSTNHNPPSSSEKSTQEPHSRQAVQDFLAAVHEELEMEKRLGSAFLSAVDMWRNSADIRTHLETEKRRNSRREYQRRVSSLSRFSRSTSDGRGTDSQLSRTSVDNTQSLYSGNSHASRTRSRNSSLNKTVFSSSQPVPLDIEGKTQKDKMGSQKSVVKSVQSPVVDVNSDPDIMDGDDQHADSRKIQPSGTSDESFVDKIKDSEQIEKLQDIHNTSLKTKTTEVQSEVMGGLHDDSTEQSFDKTRLKSRESSENQDTISTEVKSEFIEPLKDDSNEQLFDKTRLKSGENSENQNTISKEMQSDFTEPLQNDYNEESFDKPRMESDENPEEMNTLSKESQSEFNEPLQNGCTESLSDLMPHVPSEMDVEPPAVESEGAEKQKGECHDVQEERLTGSLGSEMLTNSQQNNDESRDCIRQEELKDALPNGDTKSRVTSINKSKDSCDSSPCPRLTSVSSLGKTSAVHKSRKTENQSSNQKQIQIVIRNPSKTKDAQNNEINSAIKIIIKIPDSPVKANDDNAIESPEHILKSPAEGEVSLQTETPAVTDKDDVDNGKASIDKLPALHRYRTHIGINLHHSKSPGILDAGIVSLPPLNTTGSNKLTYFDGRNSQLNRYIYSSSGRRGMVVRTTSRISANRPCSVSLEDVNGVLRSNDGVYVGDDGKLYGSFEAATCHGRVHEILRDVDRMKKGILRQTKDQPPNNYRRNEFIYDEDEEVFLNTVDKLPAIGKGQRMGKTPTILTITSTTKFHAPAVRSRKARAYAQLKKKLVNIT